MKYLYVIPGFVSTEGYWNFYTPDFEATTFSGLTAYSCFAASGSNRSQCIFYADEVIITDDPWGVSKKFQKPT